jgi:N-acetylglucosamine-6-phosphate deacetylase
MSTQPITGRDPGTGRLIALIAKDGLIARIDEPPGGCDLFLAPGFVDLQVNGCDGFDVNAADITPETIRDLTDRMLQRGVSCFAPTIITAPEDRICAALRAIADARRQWSRVAACIPYAHVEGPHISALDGYRGAHPAESVRAPSLAEFNRWQETSGGLVGMVTISPHSSESPAYIEAVVESGVHVAIGHTHASAEEIERAVNAGARLSTHLGNGIAPEIPRHLNPLWSQLADDRLTATFIADGHHLPPNMLKVMLRAKTVDRAMLVSDSVALAGMPPGLYDTPVGGRVELRVDGRLWVAGSELLAGATASLPQAISHVVHSIGLPLHEALRMATTNPGRFVAGRGHLSPGLRADAVRFRWDDEMVIEDVWLGGEQVFTRSGESRKGRGDGR